MDDLIIAILKNGAIAFVGAKITKAMSQKEIAEIIEAAGWCSIGMDLIRLVLMVAKPIIKVYNTLEKWGDILDRLIPPGV
jgi:hypothetical protein